MVNHSIQENPMTAKPSTKIVTRRRFFIASGVVLGGACLACAGLGVAARNIAPAAPTAEVATPSFTYGQPGAAQASILVTYATRTGSSVGVAEAIGQGLGARGFAVEVRPVKEAPSPAGFDYIVMGSAVNGGRWLPEAEEYARAHQAALGQAPVALFCVHGMNVGDDDRCLKGRQAYLNPVRSLVTPAAEAYFAGVGLDPKTVPAFLRGLLRGAFNFCEGDCRDWRKIRAWPQALFAG